MTHQLPKGILERIHEWVKIKDSWVEGKELMQRILIPCQVEAPTSKFSYVIQKGIIELTVKKNGVPTHLFLRSYDDKNRDFVSKNLGTNEDLLKKVKACWDALAQRQETNEMILKYPVENQIAVTFLSGYGLEISVTKK